VRALRGAFNRKIKKLSSIPKCQSRFNPAALRARDVKRAAQGLRREMLYEEYAVAKDAKNGHQKSMHGNARKCTV